jgi:hypothetical protein
MHASGSSSSAVEPRARQSVAVIASIPRSSWPIVSSVRLETSDVLAPELDRQRSRLLDERLVGVHRSGPTR